MSKLWQKFFDQVDFLPSSTNDPPITFERPRRLLFVFPQGGGPALSKIEFTPKGDLRAQPDFVHSDLLGASQLPLYNKQGDEQALICALNDQLCLMLSDPAERFAEDRRFPRFLDASGAVELAYHAAIQQWGSTPTWSLTLLTPDGCGIKGSLVVLSGGHGCLLLK